MTQGGVSQGHCTQGLRPALSGLCGAVGAFPQKLLTMMPTEEERQKIEGRPSWPIPTYPWAQPRISWMTLASIGGLAARLQLWAFKLGL